MKVELDADIVEHITLLGLKDLKKSYKKARDVSYTTNVPVWDVKNRNREYVLNDIIVKAISLVKGQYEVEPNTDKLFYELAKSCAELGETYK